MGEGVVGGEVGIEIIQVSGIVWWESWVGERSASENRVRRDST